MMTVGIFFPRGVEVEEIWLAAAAGTEGRRGHQGDIPLQAG
jgi:hypothetical protein